MLKTILFCCSANSFTIKKEQPNYLDHSLFITSMIIISQFPFQKKSQYRSHSVVIPYIFVTFCKSFSCHNNIIISYLKKKDTCGQFFVSPWLVFCQFPVIIQIEHTVFPISLPLVTFQVLTTQTYHFSYHFESRFCDILRYFTRFSL